MRNRRLGGFDSPILTFGIRIALLCFCLIAAGLDPEPRRVIAATPLLGVAAATALLPVRRLTVRRLLPVVEAVVAAAAVVVPPVVRPSLLPYLLAPAFSAGLEFGLVPALAVPGAAVVILLCGGGLVVAATALPGFAATAAQWVLLAAAVGALAAWIRRLAAATPGSEVARSYQVAYGLLHQLRDVSRQLSEGLDAVAVAHGLLQAIRGQVAFARAAVLARSDRGHLVPLAVQGGETNSWPRSMAAVLDEIGDTGGAVIRQGPFLVAAEVPAQRTAEPTGWHAVFPVRLGGELGAVVLEADASVAPPDRATTAAIRGLVDDAAIRLETALLFGEIRSLATSEERRRLAREIHDGIAQELASMGYRIDELIAQACEIPELRALLVDLRAEVSRLISELRLSIFDLRSEVGSQPSLGAALSDYLRSVSAAAGFTVHIVLDETTLRLPIAQETELLRIAQEAITNARRHAAAQNLWVRCRVDPPFAHLRIEDDGRGLGQPRVDSFGLEVMRERAARIGAELSIVPRPTGGTIVEVRLGEQVPPADEGGVETAPGTPQALTFATPQEGEDPDE